MSLIGWKTSEYQLAGDVLTMNAAGCKKSLYVNKALESRFIHIKALFRLHKIR